QRTKDALAAKKAAGVRLGRRPNVPQPSSAASSAGGHAVTPCARLPRGSTAIRCRQRRAASSGTHQLCGASSPVPRESSGRTSVRGTALPRESFAAGGACPPASTDVGLFRETTGGWLRSPMTVASCSRVPHGSDAQPYDSLAVPHTLWGRRTLARLDPSGVSRVLDAGCGTGRDTELLLDLIPDVRVVAVDASRAMLEQLATRLADRRERVEIIHADLTEPLPIAEPVDAIISVAAFHWISDHATLFRNLAGVLCPGGHLVAECGGEGNVESIVAAIDDVLGESPAIWNFAGVEETEQR